MASRFDTSPLSPFKPLWRHPQLIAELSRREITGRYRGSVFGLFWSFINPLIMLGVYTFIFSIVFEAKWPGAVANKGEFALILFCGLIVFTLFSECVNRAPGIVLANVMFVKKVVFPLETLPWVVMLSALFHFASSFVILLVFVLIVYHELHWTVLLAPLLLLPLITFTMGVSWFLASLGVFLRDIAHVVGIVTTILMFMSPIFYPVAAVPEKYRLFLRLNPLSYTIEEMREVVLWGRIPDWYKFAAYFAGAALVAWLGFIWFQRTRKGFADVL